MRTTIKMRTGILFILNPPDELDNVWQVTVLDRHPELSGGKVRVVDSYDITRHLDERGLRYEIVPRLYNTVSSTLVGEYEEKIEELIREQVAALEANPNLPKTE